MEPQAAIQDVVTRFYAAVDGRDWDGVTELMTDPFYVDYSSFGGDAPSDLYPDVIVEEWQELLPGFDSTCHQLGDLDVAVNGANAKVQCDVTVTHTIGDRVWTVLGRYENTLAFEAETWMLSGSQFIFDRQEGDTELQAEARRRAEAL